MTTINIKGENKFTNTQMGGRDIMIVSEPVQSSDTAPYMTKENWDELKTFIENNGREKGISEKDIGNITACAQSQDEQGLKKALASDAKNFLISVLGGIVSPGLIAALKTLFGMT